MIDLQLLGMVPPLRRARGDRLYGADQQHWVDLWKQDGAWLLGHRPEGAAKEWKNQLDKGLASWAPSLWPQRLLPLVRQLLPATVAVRVFRNADRAPRLPLWRPWEGPLEAPAMRLVLPTGPGHAVAAVYREEWTESLPENDVTSPAEAAALVHAVAQVLRFSVDPGAIAARSKAEATFDRLIGPSGLFDRRGVWFTATNQARYAQTFRAHWDAGFLLNPDGCEPSVIPTELSEGEWAAWHSAVKEKT